MMQVQSQQICSLTNETRKYSFQILKSRCDKKKIVFEPFLVRWNKMPTHCYVHKPYLFLLPGRFVDRLHLNHEDT